MTPSYLVAHLRALWRTERTITELRLKRLLTNLGLQALAVLMSLCALLLLEFAAYLGLIQHWDAIASAIALGLVNLVFACLVVFLARRRPLSRELALATEMHQQAIEAFETDLDSHGSASMRAAIESAIIPALLPLIPVVIERLHKHKSETTSDQTA
jgi:hypothetical protein